MALSFLDNVDYRGKKPNFARDLFKTKSEMAAFSENYLPDVFITSCVEDGMVYVFDRSNTVDPELGKWRSLKGESSGSSELTNPITVSETVGGSEQGTIYPVGTSIEDVIADVLSGESKSLTMYYGTVDDVTTIDIATLTEATATNGTELSFTSDNKYIVIVYEDTEDALVAIRDDNEFNYNSEFTLSTLNINGVDYKVYSMSNKTTCTDFIFKIKF